MTKSERLARAVERELAVLCQGIAHYFDKQIAQGRDAIVLVHSAETGVSFKIRDAGWTTGKTLPDGYVVLREERTLDAPNRPRYHWYGLVHRLPSGEERYEGFHCHLEPGGLSIANLHFQVDINGTADRARGPAPWPRTAMERQRTRRRAGEGRSGLRRTPPGTSREPRSREAAPR